MAWHDKCTKCGHKEPFHRQRDVRMWALDECNLFNCYCNKYSSNKKFIGKFTRQGVPLVLSEELQSQFIWDDHKRDMIEKMAITIITTKRECD